MCAECLEEKHAGVIYGLHAGDFDFRYIGQSTNHRKRYRSHISDSLRRGLKYEVNEWIRQNGEENIHMTIIETFTEDELHLLNEREKFYIAQQRAGYGEPNLNGDSGGTNTSPETKAKLSAVRTGKKRTPESIEKQREGMIGKAHSPETRAKMSASHLAHSEQKKETMRLNMHIRWHVNRDIIKAGCTLCEEVK